MPKGIAIKQCLCYFVSCNGINGFFSRNTQGTGSNCLVPVGQVNSFRFLGCKATIPFTVVEGRKSSLRETFSQCMHMDAPILSVFGALKAEARVSKLCLAEAGVIRIELANIIHCTSCLLANSFLFFTFFSQIQNPPSQTPVSHEMLVAPSPCRLGYRIAQSYFQPKPQIRHLCTRV